MTALEQAGVLLVGRSVDDLAQAETVRVDTGTEELVFEEPGGGAFRAGTAVFAPEGMEPGLPQKLGASGFFGKGVSHSALSDGKYFEGLPVAVVGVGFRALSQALILSRWASRIELLCDRELLPSAHPLLDEMYRCKRIRLHRYTTVRSLIPNDEGRLAAVTVRSPHTTSDLPVNALFVAQEPTVSWDLWGGKTDADSLSRQGKLVSAGFADGVDYWAHAKLFASGVASAERLMTTL